MNIGLELITAYKKLHTGVNIYILQNTFWSQQVSNKYSNFMMKFRFCEITLRKTFNYFSKTIIKT